ncbi:nuclear transport factor 2 family protein [Flavobacterium silvaticum]|uniref:Nuclear transport factor 2 family protein n=1 Tax=Flavobacterium silvaticum TaxID=1852020 RepID=A0A972FPN3_9FLAO|nr:nuclear transport factor 2 family protein [Flavobacterium silvaticum]NMH29080.1 nuclear transport factor 2 family protein [Flavobacterium silvaticum]
MDHNHQQLIEEFYAAFAAHEPETMASCYHPEAHFTDPIFGTLQGRDIADMWRMLLERSKGQLNISFSNITADHIEGKANWIASYVLSSTRRKIENHISSRFIFRDGLIADQKDTFDFYSWNRQAFGFKGWLLGKTTFMQDRVRQQAISSLRKWQSKKRNAERNNGN